MTEHYQEDTVGLALANHTLVVGLGRLLTSKGLVSQVELDGVVNDSLTVLETAVPDRDAVRYARVILEQMLVCRPLSAPQPLLTDAELAKVARSRRSRAAKTAAPGPRRWSGRR